MKKENKHLLVIVVGGSGTGKTTVAQELVNKGIFEKAITYTTRKPRVNEINNVHYMFLDNKEQLEEINKKGELIESPNEFGGNWYGCPISSVYKNKPVIVVLEFKGLKQAVELLNKDPNLIVATVFLEPLSEDEIRKRIIDRGSEEEELKTRLKELETEKPWGNFDYSLRITQDTSLSKEKSIEKTTNEIISLVEKYKPSYNLKKNKIKI